MGCARIYSPSPTVSGSAVPFYLAGTQPGLFEPHSPTTAMLEAFGIDPDTADMIFAAVVSGEISKEEFEEFLGGKLTDQQFNQMLYGTAGAQIPAGNAVAADPFGPSSLSGIGQDDSSFPFDVNSATWSEDGEYGYDAAGNILDTSTGLIYTPSGSTYDFNTGQPATSEQIALSTPGTTGPMPANAGITTGPLTQQEAASNAVLQAGGTPAQAAKAASAVNNNSSNAQVASAVASALKSTMQIATASTAPKITLAPTGSLTSLLSKSSIIAGVPDVAVYGVALIGILAIAGKR